MGGFLELNSTGTVVLVADNDGGVCVCVGEEGEEITEANGDVDWWAQIKQSPAKDGFADESV